MIGHSDTDSLIQAGATPVIIPLIEDRNDLARVLDLLDGIVMIGGADLDPRRDIQVLSPMRRGLLGVESLNAELQALLNTTEGLQQQRELMQRIGRALHADAKMRFRQGKAPDGTPWLPLKTRQGQPLRDTGRLQRSIAGFRRHRCGRNEDK